MPRCIQHSAARARKARASLVLPAHCPGPGREGDHQGARWTRTWPCPHTQRVHANPRRRRTSNSRHVDAKRPDRYGRGPLIIAVTALVSLAAGCTHVVSGTALMPPTASPYLDGMDVDELLLTTAELRDLTGAGSDLNGVPGMDSTQTVDDELLIDAAPTE